MAYLFTKIRSIGAGFFIHGYCKFMGIPNIIELLRMDMHDHTAKSNLYSSTNEILNYPYQK